MKLYTIIILCKLTLRKERRRKGYMFLSGVTYALRPAPRPANNIQNETNISTVNGTDHVLGQIVKITDSHWTDCGQ